jgi:hypothetical protein
MVTEEFLKSLADLFSNPFFKKGFYDFFLKVQQEGIETAKKFWNLSPARQRLFPNTSEIFERMIDFHRNLGFVPLSKYEEIVKENERLKSENRFLMNTIRDLNQKIFTDGGKAMQEFWKNNIEKHIEMSMEIAKAFMDIFKQKGSE